MTLPPPPPEALREFIHAALGSDAVIEDCSRDVGRQSVVWRVERGDALYYMKRHEARDLYARAMHAYTHWTPQLAGRDDLHVPEIVARDDELVAILISALPGAERVSTMEPGRDRTDAHRAAGRMLRALHALAPETNLDPETHMRAEVARYVTKHLACLDADTRDWVLAQVEQPGAFREAPIVCAHRDWSPRNWAARRIAGQMVVSAFDWERAEVSCAYYDMQRMEYDHWVDAPELKHAFFEGYGGQLTPAQQRQLDLAVIINAVPSIAWAQARGDTHFERLAWSALERLRRERP